MVSLKREETDVDRVPATSSKRSTHSTPSSNRGVCDRTTGSCVCDSNYASSNGGGGRIGSLIGSKGECGKKIANATRCPYGSDETKVCMGNGYCQRLDERGNPTFKCICYAGYKGPACEQRTCPNGTAWFDEAYAVDTAHRPETECSNRGVCDELTGACTCDPRFEGEACERLKCPDIGGVKCGGHGTCSAIAHWASVAENEVGTLIGYTYGNTLNTWDAYQTYGCLCDRRSFHGPTIGDTTDHYGYDCSQIMCPFGDDPETENQVSSCLRRGMHPYVMSHSSPSLGAAPLFS